VSDSETRKPKRAFDFMKRQWEGMAGSWGPFLKRILRFPWRLFQNVRLLLYFLIVICFIGALGTLIPIAQIKLDNTTVSWMSVKRSLATYVIAIVVTAFADCIVREQEEDDATFKLFLLGVTIVSTVCAIFVLLTDKADFASTLSWIGAISAGIVWLMVHDADVTLTQGGAYSTLGGEHPE